jgi:hypothetical protein
MHEVMSGNVIIRQLTGINLGEIASALVEVSNHNLVEKGNYSGLLTMQE